MESSVLLFLLCAGISTIPNQNEARSKVSQAYLIQNGYDKMAKRFVDDNIPKDVMHYGGDAFAVTNTLMTRKITFTWSFP